MGDISIIARRLEGGKKVQYGWSGNGGYYNMVGDRLLSWYNNPDLVEYLFGLGQISIIGKPGSENGGESFFYKNAPNGTPHWFGESEREIFSKIAFISYGYFYDLDNTWYYIIPGPFRIKIPLVYIHNHLDERDYEFEERNRIERFVAEYFLKECYDSDSDFQSYILKQYPQGIEEIREDVLNTNVNHCCNHLYNHFKAIYDYFDDWVVIKSSNMTDISGIIVHKKQTGQDESRIETIDW